VRSAVISSSSLLGAGMTLTDQQCLGAGPQGTCHESWNFPRFPEKKTHHQIYGKTANSVFFISVTVFPLPRRTEKKIQKPRDKTGETVAIETVAPGVQNQAM